ncbi:MAG: hypothetical protein Q9227_001808 [Pyrenula ochraceoflavens]
MAASGKQSVSDTESKASILRNDNTPSTARSRPQSLFFVPLNAAFYLLLISHLLAALYAPIPDCDEVFNYWEPAHYLSHGYGLQTWEYSPDFALRSWFYVGLHALVGKFGFLLRGSKYFEFYSIRAMLGLISAGSETRLYSSISRTLNPRIGVLYLLITAFTAGMFQASVAFLPSSFAMYASTLGLAAFMDWQRGPKTATGIMWFGIGAIVGWPFAGLLALPFLLEEILISFVTTDAIETLRRFLDGAVRSLVVLAVQFAVDAFFYHRPIVASVRLVLYNVFSGTDRGPDIFGTEPWTFYIKNLLLNFNVWTLLALAAGPLVFLQYCFRLRATTRQTLLRTCTFIAPFYIWLLVFSLQSHKEERFMYPAYPFLALNASIAFHMILSYVGSSNRQEFIGRVPVGIKVAVSSIFTLAALNIGLLRIYGNVTAYRAPLEVYGALQSIRDPSASVCMGKEWYRFPSSYFLPYGMRAKFVKSEFSGLLPGEFAEAKIGFGLFPGTWLIPAGMNDRNEEDLGKYTDVRYCDYMVDLVPSGNRTFELEPDYSADSETWTPIACSDFLDVAKTSLLPRTLWTPQNDLVPETLQRKWVSYCLLRRRRLDDPI